MLLGCLLAVATLCCLAAAPWRAPKQFVTFSAPYLLVLAGLSQIPVLLLGQPRWAPLLGVLLIIMWGVHNRHLPGAYLLVVGTAANGVAMLLHGGAMPLAPRAAQQLGLASTAHLLAGSKDVIGQTSLWLWLSDWLVVRTPILTLVLSPGDLGIGAALCRWVYACHTVARTTSTDAPLGLAVRPRQME